MSDIWFPKLDEKGISLVYKLYKNNPDFFAHPDCPYSEDTIEVFMSVRKVAQDNEGPTHKESFEERIDRLVKELDDFGKGGDLTAAEKNTYFRLSVSLLQDLVSLQEKSSLIKQHDAFVNEILMILDQTLTPDQRTEVQQRLKKFVGDKIDETNTEESI